MSGQDETSSTQTASTRRAGTLDSAQRWLQCSRELSRAAAASEGSEELLDTIAALASRGGAADGALLFLPSIGGSWLCECSYDVEGSQGLPKAALGRSFSLPAPQMDLLREGEALAFIGDNVDAGWVDELELKGPMLAVPLGPDPAGVLILWRPVGAPRFQRDQFAPAVFFGLQTAMALRLSEVSDDSDRATLAEERERISRDLHDLAIQGLFATGMKLQNLREGISSGARRALLDQLADEAQASLQESVGQIRSIVYGLKDLTDLLGVVDRVKQEVSVARAHLGFAPSLTVEIDGQSSSVSTGPSTRGPGSLSESGFAARVDQLVGSSADDVVAVVREALTNVAKHARASSVRVDLALHGSGPSGELILTIIDDGQGVEPTVTRQSGIANMQRRATLHGGTLAAGSGPRGRGTSLVWRIPLEG